ncbi:multiple C2 and transmembrane domain-containing protein 2 [Osmerus mordax]|uniref:multiple C2 and transmembrane domain-containing protein 2 n=1 Tax=Osmerus mordax TaxID=8014 RepID=UPI00350EAC92
MDSKKKMKWENFRAKAKAPFANIKIKKGAGKKVQGKPLAHRRSISVPDLRLTPSESSSLATDLLSTTSNAIFFDSSQSDTSSISSGPLFTDRLTVPDSATPVRQTISDSAFVDGGTGNYRGSGPVEEVTFFEDEEEELSMPEESVDQPVDGISREPLTRLASRDLPVPAPRIITAARGETSSPETQQSPLVETRRSRSIERFPSSVDRSDLPVDHGAASREKANPSGEQVSFLLDKQVYSGVRGRLFSEGYTPPTSRAKLKIAPDRWSLQVATQGTPVESADGESACGSPIDEHSNAPWATDPEDLDMRESLSSDMTMFSMEPQDDMEECNEQSDQYEQPMQDQAADSDTAGGSVPAAFQRYLLTINLKEGRNLFIRDRSGASDPYVKFKIGGKMFYKSKVVRKNRDPRWNESFSYALRDRDHSVDVRVYDRNLTSDVFMGSSTLVLTNLELDKTCEMELCLDNPKCKVDTGVIVLETCLTLRDATIKRNPRWLPKRRRSFRGGQQNLNQIREQRTTEAQAKSQLWSGLFGISLVEGQEMPQNGYGDIYVRFRLGEQKYKSKNLCIQANPQWREQFDFNNYDDVLEPLQVEVYAKRGRKCEECWGMFDIDLTRLSVDEKQLYTHMLDPGRGSLVLLVTLSPSWGVSVSNINACPLDQPDNRDIVLDKYSLKNTHKSMREVGFLQVQVLKATDVLSADLNGKSDPFCVVELGNSRLQTQTIYKTLNPEWNQVLAFPIKDIHEVLELTVFDENTDKSTNFLGKVAIPLLFVPNGQQVSYQLKKEDLGRPSKGTITLVMEVIYNPIRAGVKTFKPKETKFLEDSPKFSKKVLAQNIYRVRKISTAVLYTLQYIKSCFQWESTQRSIIAFLMFVLTVWHWELFMLPLFLLLLVGWNYVQITLGRISSNQDLVNMTMADEEEEDEKESGKKGLMEKIHMVQEIVITVQNILDEIASVGERIKNTFNWSVPFLSCLACLVLFVATTALYYIPLRYIVLIWGVNKFTKKLRSPYAIDNNEILDFLKRVPSDVQMVQYSELRSAGVQGPPKKRK